MDGFTFVDGIVAVLIILSALLAYSRGVVREIMAIAGWVLAAIVAVMFLDFAQPLVRQIPVVGNFLGDSCELSVVVSFAVVFILALLVVSVFTPLLSALIQRSALASSSLPQKALPHCTALLQPSSTEPPRPAPSPSTSMENTDCASTAALEIPWRVHDPPLPSTFSYHAI